MNFVFLDVPSVKALHAQQIVRFGGLNGIRNEGLLESAVLRAEYRALYDPTASAATIAASLAWGLVKNHAFLDGNKRIGLASMVVFLDLNGYRLHSTEEEEIEIILKLAGGQITEEEWTDWVRSATVDRAEE